MQVDYDKILKEAEAKKVSPYLLVKQKIGYRAASKIDIFNQVTCAGCQLRCISPYDIKELQCRFIGINKDIHAIVDGRHNCKGFCK